MSLQTQNLVMTGLGILNDVPPNAIRPGIADGVHLRWAFKPERGFPWYGYYLYRRRHRAENPQCLGPQWNSLALGPLAGRHMHFPFGCIDSNANLRLTDDFPAPGGDGKAEFDLRNRRHLNFLFNPSHLARRVNATIGFRDRADIEISSLIDDVPVGKVIASGRRGRIVSVSLEFDAISAVRIGGGPAVLIDVCIVPVSDEATKGWKLVPDFSYPLQLPVFHPD